MGEELRVHCKKKCCLGDPLFLLIFYFLRSPLMNLFAALPSLICLPSQIPNVTTVPVRRKEGDGSLCSWLLTTNVAFAALQKLRIPGRDKQGSSYKYRANEIHCREDFGSLPGMKKEWMQLDTAGVYISANTFLIWGH